MKTGRLLLGLLVAFLLLALSLISGLTEIDSVKAIPPVAKESSSRSGYGDEAEYNAWQGDKVDTEVHLPFVNTDPSWGWRTTTVVQNTSTEVTTVTLCYRDTDGGVTKTINDILPAAGSRVYTPTGVFSGSLVITGTQSLAVSVNESPLDSSWAGDGLMSYRGIGSNAGSMDSEIALVPIWRGVSGWNSFFAVKNLDDTAATVTLQFYETGGTPVHSEDDTLPAQSAHWYDVKDIPELGDGFNGFVRVQSDKPVAGVVHAVNAQTQETVAHNNRALMPNMDISYGGYLPLVVRNNTSVISLYNLSNSSANVALSLYSRDGSEEYNYTVMSLGTAAMQAISLDDEAWSPPVPDGFSGSVVIFSDQSVGALVNTDWPFGDGATMTGYSGVMQPTSSAYVPFVRWTDDVVTRISVQNAGASAADVTVTYYAEDGSEVGQATKTVPANAAHIFDQADNGLSSPFRGTAVVKSVDPIAVTGFISRQREPTQDSQPDLLVSKSVNLFTFGDGDDTLTYTVSLRNGSTATATTTLTDSFPVNTSYVPGSAAVSDGSTVTVAVDQLRWSGKVISGTPIILEFALRMPPDLSPGDAITNEVTVDDGTGVILTDTIESVYNPGYSLSINDGRGYTRIPTVTLTLTWDPDDGIEEMQISNDGGFGDATWFDAADKKEHWKLDTYSSKVTQPTVYARFRDSGGTLYPSSAIQDDIVYDPGKPEVTQVEIITQSLQGVSVMSGQAVTVSVTASDDNSGVGTVRVSHNPNTDYEAFNFYGNTTEIPWTLQPSGKVYVQVEDRAGNRSEVSSVQGPGHSIYLPLVLRKRE
jgi:uncharacterized repeat protein (TIGR01451 family)